MNKYILILIFLITSVLIIQQRQITKLERTITGLTYLMYATNEGVRSFAQVFSKYENIKDPEAKRFLQARTINEFHKLADVGELNALNAKAN